MPLSEENRIRMCLHTPAPLYQFFLENPDLQVQPLNGDNCMFCHFMKELVTEPVVVRAGKISVGSRETKPTIYLLPEWAAIFQRKVITAIKEKYGEVKLDGKMSCEELRQLLH